MGDVGRGFKTTIGVLLALNFFQLAFWGTGILVCAGLCAGGSAIFSTRQAAVGERDRAARFQADKAAAALKGPADAPAASGNKSAVAEEEPELIPLEEREIRPLIAPQMVDRPMSAAAKRAKDASDRAEAARRKKDDVEAQAMSRLRAAKVLLQDGKTDQARKWLKKITDECPGSAAAKEADRLLKQ